MHRVIPAACVFYLVWIAYFFGFIHPGFHSEELAPLFNESRESKAQIVEDPDLGVTTTKIVVRIMRKSSSDSVDSQSLSNEKVLVRMNTENATRELEYGDWVVFKGVIEAPESFVGDTGRVFNYPAYLAVQEIYGIVTVTSIEIVDNDDSQRNKEIIVWFLRKLYRIKRWFVGHTLELFQGDEAGLLAGILIGEKSLISKESQSNFQIAGLSHIVVLSGYNITLVGMVIMGCFTRLGLGYRLRRIGAVLVIPLFVLMTGTGASSVRAGIMSCITLLLQVEVRPQHSFRVILYTLTVMVFTSPEALFYDPSLHLSFLAFIGLLYLTPIIKSWSVLDRWLHQLPEEGWVLMISNLVIETFSVQLFVLPYIIYMSGQFSFLSLAANIVTVPLIPYLMVGGLVAVIISTGSLLVGMVIAQPITWGLRYVIAVADYISRITWAHYTFPVMSAYQLLVVYGLAVLLLVWWHRRSARSGRNE